MPQSTESPNSRVPQHLLGTRQGLFFLLGVAPAGGRQGGSGPSRPAGGGLAPIRNALQRAAMGDMFCFKHS